jgi:hypothetical protein
LKIEVAHSKQVTLISREICVFAGKQTGFEEECFKVDTRPDLAYGVSVVSQFIHGLGVNHLETINCTLQNLKSTPRRGLLFKRGEA